MFLGPVPALIIGFFTGIGRTFGLTHQPFDPFYFAFAAWMASQLMQQRYFGWFYRWLRLPLISAMLCQISAAVLAAFTAFVSVSGNLLAATYAALSAFEAQFWPLLVAGLVAGLIGTLFVILAPPRRQRSRLVPSPAQRSVRSHLLADFSLFGGAMILLTVILVFIFALFLSTQLLIAQMAAASNAAAGEIVQFRANLENVLSQFGDEEERLRRDKASAARALGDFYRTARLYERVLLLDDQMSVSVRYPDPKRPLP